MGAVCCRSATDDNDRHCHADKVKYQAERHASDKDRYAVDPTRQHPQVAAAVSASIASVHAVELLIAEGKHATHRDRAVGEL
jgi:hypothetical protein